MAPLLLLSWAIASLLLASASAHFTLDYPQSLAMFDEDTEPTGPCGGPSLNSSSPVTDFHVGGDNLAMTLLHPQGTWLFRATLDTTASSGWSVLFPEVQQSGLGQFCEPKIPVNASWAGKKGIISVVVDAPDGILYQCAAVNFVNGTASSNQATCVNGSSITGSFISDQALATVASASGSTSSSTASPSASQSHSAAPGSVGNTIPIGNLLVVMAMGLMGAAMML